MLAVLVEEAHVQVLEVRVHLCDQNGDQNEWQQQSNSCMLMLREQRAPTE